MAESERSRRVQAGGDYLECEAIWIQTSISEVAAIMKALGIQHQHPWWRRVMRRVLHV